MFHLGAFYQSRDSAGVLANILAVPDQAIFTNANDMRVPADLVYLLGEGAMSAQTAPQYAQVQSPSLRDLANQDVGQVQTAVVWGADPEINFHPESPRQFAAYESINFAIDATGGAAAANYGLVWIGDGSIKAVNGGIFSVRATSAATLSAGVWVNSALTFNTTLPAGTYQVVGMRAQGTNLVAARLVFIGQSYRPGVPAVNTSAQRDWRYARNGMLGVMGQFDINQPPTVDCLGVTDTSQTFLLDLIKVK